MKTSTCTTSAAPLSGTMKPATLQKKKKGSGIHAVGWQVQHIVRTLIQHFLFFFRSVVGCVRQENTSQGVVGGIGWWLEQWFWQESHIFSKGRNRRRFSAVTLFKKKKKERKRRRWRLRWNSLLGSERRLLPTNGSVSGFEKVIWRGREKRGCTYADQGADQWVTPAFLASWRYWKRPLFHKITSQIMPQRPEREPARDSSGKDRFQHPEGDVYKVCFCEFSFRLKACVWCFFSFNSRGKK